MTIKERINYDFGTYKLRAYFKIMIKEYITKNYNSKSFILIQLFLSIVAFGLGISLPIFSNTKFFFFSEDISLLKSIQILFSQDDYFLGLIILLFTILTPILKYIIIIVIQFSTNSNLKKRFANLLTNIGKWSMLDVFVIALIIITMKIDGGFFEVEMKIGTIFFAVSVILSLILSSQIINNLEYHSDTIKGK